MSEKRDNFECQACQMQLREVVPFRDGGQAFEWNFVPCSMECLNRKRGDDGRYEHAV